MSRRYETTVTVTVAGDEKDVTVRAHVDCGPGLGMGGAIGAALDSDVEFRIGRAWVSADEADLSEGDLARATEALEEMALSDDREECADDEDDEDMMRSCA